MLEEGLYFYLLIIAIAARPTNGHELLNEYKVIIIAYKNGRNKCR